MQYKTSIDENLSAQSQFWVDGTYSRRELNKHARRPGCSEYSTCKLKRLDTIPENSVQLPEEENYLCKTDVKGQGYKGFISETGDGIVCQRWDENHENYTIISYTRGDRNHNYCRNPNGDPKGPWCYLSIFDGKRLLGDSNKGYCTQIELCQGSNPSVSGPKGMSSF